MLTNKYNLPKPLVNAILNDPYTKGNSDITVTTLIQPPQMRALMKGREVSEDAADCIWRLLGQAVHAILERACPETSVAEQRVYTEVLGWVVSGQFDLLEDGTLNDYKVTSVYARDGKIEWVQQINLLAAILRRNGTRVERGQIVAIFRDWRRMEALSGEYPQAQVSLIPVPLWPEAEADAYLEERVLLHQMANPPPCTDEERWMQPPAWALMQGEVDRWALMNKGAKRALKIVDDKPDDELKPGQFWEHRPVEAGKRAIKLFDSEPSIQLGRGQFIEHRPGRYRRCEDYCGASEICEQWAKDRPDAAR